MRDISETEFDDLLAEAEGLVLVDFWADWCRPCHVQTPILAALEPEFPDITFIKVNTEENQELARAFGIRALPTVVLLEPRRPGPGADVVHSAVGVKPRPFWEKTLRDACTPKVGWLQRIKRAFGRAPSQDQDQDQGQDQDQDA